MIGLWTSLSFTSCLLIYHNPTPLLLGDVLVSQSNGQCQHSIFFAVVIFHSRLSKFHSVDKHAWFHQHRTINSKHEIHAPEQKIDTTDAQSKQYGVSIAILFGHSIPAISKTNLILDYSGTSLSNDVKEPNSSSIVLEQKAALYEVRVADVHNNITRI